MVLPGREQTGPGAGVTCNPHSVACTSVTRGDAANCRRRASFGTCWKAPFWGSAQTDIMGTQQSRQKKDRWFSLLQKKFDKDKISIKKYFTEVKELNWKPD